MFGFGNWWQSLWTNGCLELYLKGLSIGFSWSPFVGFKESLWWPRCYSRNYLKIGLVIGWSRLIQRVNQVDRHTKRRRCTERDQVIPRYGKHCQLRFVYYPMVFVRVLCGVRMRCASSSDASQRDQVLEACRPLWWQWTCEDERKSGSPIVEYGGAIN